jgi:hypothetical protein
MRSKRRRDRLDPAIPPQNCSISRPNTAEFIKRHARQQRRRRIRASRIVEPSAAARITDEFAIVAAWLIDLGDDETLFRLRRALVSGDRNRTREASVYIERLAQPIVRGIALDLWDVRPVTGLGDARVVADVLGALNRKDAAVWRGVAAYLASGASDIGVDGMVADIMALGVAALHVGDVG